MNNKEYCIACYKEKISYNQFEIQYLKNKSLIKKIFNPISYLYLIFKSNPNELFLNYNLYKALKNSKCFDIGFYLKNNPDLLNSLGIIFFC